MGRWFPGFRPATAEQTRAYRDACVELFRNTFRETADRRGLVPESAEYLRLTDQLDARERPLSRTQAAWHWQRALTVADNENTRAARAERREARRARRRPRARR